MNIVVANSVGVDAQGYHIVHVPSRWSLGVKNFTNCAYYPWQLAYTSSLLKRETPHHVKFLDGILNAWNGDDYFEKIAEEKPDWLVMESSSRTIAEDLRLARRVKEEFGTRLIFAGQHPMAQPEEVLQTADHVGVGEYEFAVLALIRGDDPKIIPGVFPNPRGELLDVDALPFPEDEDVRRVDYHEPNCRYRQVQMYASRGCPRRCNVCAAATLYYDELNWRPRKVESVVEEIRTLKEKYPEMEGVFFDEEAHNIKKSFNIQLARAIREAGLDGLKYEAMSEYASFDEEAVEEMRRAGYYKMRVGVETASDKVARLMTLGKKHDLKKLRRMLEFGKTVGMTHYATFSMGGLGSDRDEDQKTVDLIYELSSRGLLDEIQVSVNTPQPGTDFYKSALEQNLIRTRGDWSAFDGAGHVVVDYPHYPAEQIREMFQKALSAFDNGKGAAASAPFMQTAGTSMEQIPKGSRVLVLRNARLWLVFLIAEALKNFRDIRPDLLGQNAVADAAHSNPFVEQFYSYGDGFFSARCLTGNLLEELKANRYDTILVPLANNHLEGYRNVLEAVRLLHPAPLVGVYPDGSLVRLDPTG